MNERFDEIVRQTRLYNQSVYDNGEGGWIVQTAELKKFAELIVRDCMDIAANIGEHGPVAAQEMRELFGVEDA
jgi:hypothetical protein